jgi:hypothetical protein
MMSNVVETSFDPTDATPASIEIHLEKCETPRHQRDQAKRLVERWRHDPWPAGLAALSWFVSTDGQYVLTYERWQHQPADPDPDQVFYQSYRLVKDETASGPPRQATCFPAAVYRMSPGVSAAGWIDRLQSTEDHIGSAQRRYEGGIAANFHVSTTDDRVLLLAAWENESEAIRHRQEMVAKLLEINTVEAVDHEARYTHFSTLRKGVDDQ